MKTLFCAVIFVCFAFLNVSGQSGKTPNRISPQAYPVDAKAIKNRPLIIKRTGDVKVDNDVEMLVKKLWKYNAEILFCDNKTIETKLALNEAGYGILSFDLVNFVVGGKIPEGTKNWVRVSIKLSERYNKTLPVYYQDVIANYQENELTIQKREIIFSLLVLQNHLMARLEEKRRGLNHLFESMENAGVLEKKILLIDEKFFGDKYTAEEMKVEYPFQFKVSNRAEIEKAQLEGNKEYAYLELTPMGADINLLAHMIVNCEDGEFLSFGEYYNGFGDKYSNFVSKAHAANYAHNSGYRKDKKKEKTK